jgi:hypothetical protein
MYNGNRIRLRNDRTLCGKVLPYFNLGRKNKMDNGIMNKCCCGSKSQSTYKIENDNTCPVCKTSGIKVKNITVKHNYSTLCRL